MAFAPGYRSVAYFTDWCIYSREYRPQHLPIERLTHILYAFANIRESGEVVLTDTWADVEIHWEDDSWNDVGTNVYGCVKQLNLLKLKNRNLKVLLSIGGWTYSSSIRKPASTPQGRALFAQSALQLVKQLGFDGLDVDWEYPQNAVEASHYVALLYECRRALDAYGASLNPPFHFELTVACPAGPQNFEKLDIPAMDQYLDFWNVMSYDYAGSWDMLTGHQANLFPHRTMPHTTPFNTVTALQHYLTRGVAPQKLVMGMPLYGRAFEKTDGLGRPYDGIGEGSWEKGVYDFKVLPMPGAEEFYDPEIVASYSYDREKRILITYDNRDVAMAKAQYLREQRLGGAMWWEVSADREGPESLIRIVTECLGGPRALQQKANCITFPETKYDNLRNNFR